MNRYALDVNVERAEDVLTHKRLLHLAEDPANRPAFEVRLVQVYRNFPKNWRFNFLFMMQFPSKLKRIAPVLPSRLSLNKIWFLGWILLSFEYLHQAMVWYGEIVPIIITIYRFLLRLMEIQQMLIIWILQQTKKVKVTLVVLLAGRGSSWFMCYSLSYWQFFFFLLFSNLYFSQFILISVAIFCILFSIQNPSSTYFWFGSKSWSPCLSS